MTGFVLQGHIYQITIITESTADQKHCNHDTVIIPGNSIKNGLFIRNKEAWKNKHSQGLTEKKHTAVKR